MIAQGPRVAWINSVDELRSCAQDWDDLWDRSEVTLPTGRAELLAQWIESFAPHSDFRAVVVKDGNRLAAALPLLSTRLYRLLSASAVPANAWLPTGGTLLLDRNLATPQVMDLLLDAIASLPQQVLWLDEVALEQPRWQALWSAAARAGMGISFHERYAAGVIEIGDNWDKYRASWSRGHRYNMGRFCRQLASLGELRFEILSNLDPGEVELHLRRGFEVEHRSWKGAAGSSVLARGMFPYFVAQAKQLAAWRQLGLAFLTLDSRPIAFCYGLASKGVYHTFKIAYDPDFAKLSPGSVMCYHTLERLFQDAEYRAVDIIGLLTDAFAHWRPRAYKIGIAMIAPRRMLGRVATYGHKHWWPSLRKLKCSLRRAWSRSS
jgi:CelD/BcsL family acetyltransferase involved in cellulose biosynthesis